MQRRHNTLNFLRRNTRNGYSLVRSWRMFVCNIMAFVSPKSHLCSGLFIALPHAKPDCILNFADLGDKGCLLCVENLIYDPHQPLLRLYNVFSYWIVPCLAGMHLTELVAWLQVALWKGLLTWSLCNDIGPTKPQIFRQLPGTAFTKQVYVLTKNEQKNKTIYHLRSWWWFASQRTGYATNVSVSSRHHGCIHCGVILDNDNYSYDAWGIPCTNACQISCTYCWCPSPHIKRFTFPVDCSRGAFCDIWRHAPSFNNCINKNMNINTMIKNHIDV